jgi:hypothetical protein
MRLHVLPGEFSVCKISGLNPESFNGETVFFAKAGGGLSLVCATKNAPEDALEAEHGWRAFMVEGPLDFSLVGVLARISAVLAAVGISIFAVSTYDTDYVLIKKEKLPAALSALEAEGYDIINA